jgi:hypothetical protein
VFQKFAIQLLQFSIVRDQTAKAPALQNLFGKFGGELPQLPLLLGAEAQG